MKAPIVKTAIQLNNKKIVIALMLILLGLTTRTIWHLGPNVETVTGATLLAASYLGKKWALIVPVSIMFLSDLIIGNTNIFLFTWTAYIVIGCLGNLSSLEGLEGIRKILKATVLGIIASFWFYLWTNLGVWLLDSFGMYTKTISGLVDCYVLALPFLKYNLLGNLVFVPFLFILAEILKRYDFAVFFKLYESCRR